MRSLPKLTRFGDLKGNFVATSALRKVFLTEEKLPTICIVFGPTGGGKSSLATILEHELPAEVLVVTSNTHNIDQTLTNFIQHRTIVSMFNTRKKIVFIDDIDILITIDKSIVTLIQTLRQDIRIVCTVSSSEERKVCNLKKIATDVVRLTRMSVRDCFLFVRDIATVDDDDALLTLCKTHECNLKKILVYLESLEDHGRSASSVSQTDVFHDTSVYEQSRMVLNQPMPNSLLWSVAETDAQMTTLLLHENIVNVGMSRAKDTKELLRVYDSLINGDLYERTVFTRCAWGYLGVNSLYFARLALINQFAHARPKTTDNIKFTQQFTKLSTQMNTKKKLLELAPEMMDICKLFPLLIAVKSKLPIKTLADLQKRFGKDFGL